LEITVRSFYVVAALAIAACSPSEVKTQTPATEPALRSDTSGAVNYGPELADCAGAIAALADIDVAAYPERDGDWENLFGAILALTDKEAPFPNGQTARQAIEARRVAWSEQPRATVEARANVCQARFGPQQN
jgi:hypothetical protein